MFNYFSVCQIEGNSYIIEKLRYRYWIATRNGSIADVASAAVCHLLQAYNITII
jgi:hypothetical protein